MKIVQLENIGPGNPFLKDYSSMGTQLGTNVSVMYAKFGNDRHDYIIVVNTETGERFKVFLNEGTTVSIEESA